MSQENVELVVEAYDAFNRRDLGALLALMDAGRRGRVAHGRDGGWLSRPRRNPPLVAEPARKLSPTSPWRLSKCATMETWRSQSCASTLTARDSDTPLDENLWYVDPMAARPMPAWRTYETEADALEAVGLSE